MLLSPFPISEPWRAVRGRDRSRRGAEAECLQASSHLTRKRTRLQTPDLAWARDERDDRRPRRIHPPHTIEEPRRRPMPRLERQGAFCASRSWDLQNADVVLDGISLYSLGVLHDDDDDDDDEDEKAFCLDVAYSPRPTKRAKRTHDRQQFSVGRLPTTGLSDDDDMAITRFLPSSGGGALYGHSTTKKRPTKTLALTHSLAGSGPTLSPPPMSSPPDLVSDTEEDYDGGDAADGDRVLLSGPDADVNVVVIVDDREEMDGTTTTWIPHAAGKL